MEGTARKSALMNPNLLKAGVPFAVALGAFIYSVIKTRRKFEIEGASSASKAKVSCDETDSEEEFQNQESSQGHEEEEGKEEEQLIQQAHVVNSLRTFGIRDCYLEEEMLHLMDQLKALQDREQEIEKRFVRFCNLKEQESVLIELQNMLVLETAHVEFLNMMIESMEDEKQRLEGFLVEFLRAIEQIELARRKNKFLERRVKKLLRSTREQSHLLSQQASTLRDRDSELLTIHNELERREEIMKESQEEIMELKRIVGQLEEEKREMAEKLELAEATAPSTSKV